MGVLQQFKISEVIEKYDLDVDEIASILFPTVKYPKLAFDRILNGEAELNVSQIESLALHIGIFVGELFTINSLIPNIENGKLVFTRDDYKAIVNNSKDFVSLYKNNVFIDKYVLNIEIISISDFINIINNFIKNYEYTKN